ncbi:uncharacterized protein MAM_01831 [Metarhizium album ARSEF 1941]|uniref:Uncharacterized protein n=1 Tax=Metarhizium album (strain ARSEF 1941) TaxID=1081103 RepID=A0A0B2X2E5_METAS|nr:uncharacterized protein MAM_01831 [Metarhizium album ARSEF 1941]KHN99907.1 hypothetical protein MAM_01831 [Metarhizium album ARSEF 1941]
MSDKHEVTQTENGPARPGKKALLKNHCKRFWWLHLIIFLVVTAAVIVVVIFVGVKNIAQAKINDADLKIQGVNILNSAPNRFLMQINSTIRTDGTVKADIDPFVGNLSLRDVPGARPFVKLQFPSTNANKFQTVNISQEVDITDMEAFAEFNRAFFQNETLRVAISGKTKVQPAGLSKKYDVDFYKVVTFKALNKLNGTALSDMNVRVGTAEDGIPNFNATATIMNPSYYTIDIGNASFNNFADNQLIGNLTINNLVLRPGQNVVPVSAILDQTVIISAASKRPYCETGKIGIELQGMHVRQGTEEITWLTDALSSANQTVEISLADTFRAAGLSNFQASCSS